MTTSIDCILEIVREVREIEDVRFHEFPAQLPIQQKISNSEAEKFHITNALKVREKYSLPFWDSVMLTYFSGEFISDEILKLALYHNDRTNYHIFTRETMPQLASFSQSSVNLAFNSKVNAESVNCLHIPLLDLHIPKSDRSLEVVKAVIRHLALKSGYILDSGKSYHFIGNELISYEELERLLYKSLLYSPIVDKSWIAHQLMEKSCSLRITPKNGVFPSVVARL